MLYSLQAEGAVTVVFAAFVVIAVSVELWVLAVAVERLQSRKYLPGYYMALYGISV